MRLELISMVKFSFSCYLKIDSLIFGGVGRGWVDEKEPLTTYSVFCMLPVDDFT